MKKIFALLILLALTSSARAGSLFPPDNIGGNPNIACPNGSVLRWMGNRVDCADPTGGVNLMCPTGSVLQGISYGQPVCVALPTGTTTASNTSVSTSTTTSTAVSGSASSSASASATAQASTDSGTTNTVVRHWN